MPLVLVDLLSYSAAVGAKGGGMTYVKRLYTEFGRSDHEFEFVGLATRDHSGLDLSWFPGDVVASPVSGRNHFSWAYGELFSVARAARRLKADLVHCPATLGPRRTTMPVVVTIHDMHYWSHPEFMTTPLYTAPVKWMEVQVARNAARIVTDSEVSRQEIVKYLKFPPDRIDVAWLAGEPPDEAAAASRDRRPDLILASGNRRPHKNYVSLVRALPLIEPARRPHLVVTGSTGDDPLRPVVAELGLREWVELKGWVSDSELADLYATATALAVPSLQEGFGLPLIDAMMAGLPLIASDIPIFHEVAGDAAHYFDPLDHQSIADAMVAVTTRPDLAAGLVAAGRRRAGLFSWAQTAAKTMAVFRQALGRDSVAPTVNGEDL
ncbi:MAG: glycosyltransferase family 4 protein [Propionibacteriaceae bacterium]|nr:glycosyltransferase family 4 protein [Propionibacteriaceae bacterium]